MWRHAANGPLRIARVLFAASIVATSAANVRADPSDDSFFPMRPANAKIATVTGVLVRWSHGESTGSIAVRDARKHVHVFSMGFPPRIDGRVVRCFEAPRDRKAPDDPLCSDWPSHVVLDLTKVKAFYWLAAHDGKRVAVSDEVDAF